VKFAHEKGIPIAAVNIGPTRADDLISLKVEGKTGDVLSLVNSYLHE
jgi:hypothetical protein